MAVTLLSVAGCSRGEDADDGTPSADSASTTASVDQSSTAAPTTSTASTTTTTTTIAASTTTSGASSTTSTSISTTPPAPTTTVLERVDLVLEADAIGPVAFGTSEAESLAVLEAVLGDVSSDLASTYPTDRGDGTYINDRMGEAFAYPAGHTTCFDNALCVVFGGPTPGSLTFVGWVQNNQGVDAPLTTADGVTAGSIWADHIDDLDIADIGCYSTGYGTTRGISVAVFSAGDPFLAYDDAGNQIATDPDPADVTVIELSAGEQPFSPDYDC